MDTIRQELKFALRSLVKRPSYALMVTATLALGIGANTAVFSLLQALVLRSLPVADPSRLVVVSRNQSSLPYPLFRQFQDRSTTLEGVMTFRTAPWRLTIANRTERITGALVSGNYFRLLGVAASLGTLIQDGDDAVVGSGGSRGPVAVLSHGFWMRKYGGDSGAIGSAILLNGRPFTIVGVAPQGFEGIEVGAAPDVFAPMALQPTLMPSLGAALSQPRNNWLRIVGRLKPDVDVRAAEAELTSLLQSYNAEILRDPAIEKLGANWRRSLLEQRITLLPGSGGISGLRRQYSQPLFVVMAVLGLVLLIACANIANLTLSRTTARRHELAIRLGLGASRARLIAQLLIESVLLAGTGAAVGLLVARLGRDVLLTYLPFEQSLSAPLDRNVLLFTLAVSAGTALLFGLWPALQSTKVDVAPALRDGGGAKSARVPFRKALVVFQVSVSLIVVIGASLFLRSLHALLTVDAGFVRENVLVASIDVAPGRAMDTYPRVLEEARRLPGVVAAGAADAGPLGTGTGWNIYVPGYTPKANEPRSSPWVGFISPEYFKTMKVPLVLGRDFEDRDLGEGRPLVMIVNETFARHYFGTESPVGRMVGLDRDKLDVEIVGVVKDAKYTGLREEPLRMVYVPYRPGPWGAQFALHIRTAGDPSAVAGALRQSVAAIDPDAPVFNIRTVEEEIGRSLLRERLLATITSLFGGLALLLAALGLYGLLSFGVTQRTREFGIRIAVGAESGRIMNLVMREAVWMLVAGLMVGLIATWAVSRIVQTLLYGVEPTDPISVLMAVLVLVAVSVLAAWVPARRASRVDPIRALRYE